jgi:hypothetical protein
MRKARKKCQIIKRRKRRKIVAISLLSSTTSFGMCDVERKERKEHIMFSLMYSTDVRI